MRRLSIGRLIAAIFAVTVVLLFSIDTTSACRFLWRQRCYTPVYYCPPACEVVTYSSSSCCSDAIQGESVGAPTYDAPSHQGTPVPADPPAVEELGQPSDSALDSLQDTPPMPDEFNDTPVEAADAIVEEDTTVIPGDEPDLGLPVDDGDLGVFDEPAVDDGLPAMPEDDASTDDFADPLPGDTPIDDGVDDFLPGDDLDVPADDGLPADDPIDTPDDDLDDLFGDTPAVEDDDARVANNPEDDVDDLFEDIDVEEGSDLPVDEDAPDDLFPADDADDLPVDSDPLPADDDLDDLFGKTPAADTSNALGIREVEPMQDMVRVTKTAQPKVVEPSKTAAPLFRVWTDNTGSYRTVGQLVTISDTHIRLLKDNGRFSTVPKRRLSEGDLSYVHRMAKQMGTETIDKIASR